MLHQQVQQAESSVSISTGSSSRRRSRAAGAWALMGLVAICGIAAASVLIATRYSVGLSPDSRGYLMAARAILGGSGVQVIDTNGDPAPLTQLAPVYSVVLAGAALVIPGIEAAARYLNLALLSASLVLVWIIVRDASERAGAQRAPSLVGATVAALLIGLSPEVLQVHCMVWSESAFLLFTLCFIWLMTRSIEPSAGWGTLTAAAIAAGLAGVTRYSGAALIMAGCAALLIDAHRRAKMRSARAAVFAFVAGLPPAAWFARNLWLTGNLASRKVAWHPPDIQDLRYLLDTLAHWVVPHGVRVPPMLAGGLVVMCILILLLLSHPWGLRRSRAVHGGTIAGVFIVMYAIFILASKTLVDAHTRFDQRILMPVFVCGVIYLIPRLARWISTTLISRSTIIAAILLLTAGQTTRAAIWVHQAPDRWLGYGSRVPWDDSDLLAFVRDLPPDALIYSNADDVIYLRADRFAKPTPKVVDPIQDFRSGRYRRRLEAMRQDMLKQSTSSYVVCFNTIVRDYQVTTNRIRNTLDLRTEYVGRDGVVFVPTKKTRENAPPPATQPAQ